MLRAERLDGFGHLRGKFARRLKDERARHPRAGPALFEQGKQGKNEGRCLTCTRLCDAHNIAAFEGDGNSLGLNWGGGRVTGRFDGRQHFFAELKLAKSHIQLYYWNHSSSGSVNIIAHNAKR